MWIPSSVSYFGFEFSIENKLSKVNTLMVRFSSVAIFGPFGFNIIAIVIVPQTFEFVTIRIANTITKINQFQYQSSKNSLNNTVLSISYWPYVMLWHHLLWRHLMIHHLCHIFDTNFGIKNADECSALTLIRLHHNCISSRIFSFLHILLHDSSLWGILAARPFLK